MIVLDASAALSVALNKPSATEIADRVQAPDEWVLAPALIDLEFLQVLRRLMAFGEISAAAAAEALGIFRDLPVETVDHRPLIDRVWSLKGHVSAYDAAYLALAEAVDATLITCDRKLANAHGHTARVEVYA